MLYITLHDKKGIVEIEDLTVDGLREGIYQAKRLAEELEAALAESEKNDEGEYL